MITLDELVDEAPRLTHEAYLETLKNGDIASIKNDKGELVQHQIINGELVETPLVEEDYE